MKPELKLVNYDQAVLLKKVGFDEPVLYHFEPLDDKMELVPNYLTSIGNEIISVEQFFIDYNVDYFISCPTLNQVKDWLRNKKGCDITIYKMGRFYKGHASFNGGSSIQIQSPPTGNEYDEEMRYIIDGYETCLSLGIDTLLDIMTYKMK